MELKKCLPLLKEKGFILTIATGKGRASLDRLDEMLGFDKYFDFNICPSESEPKAISADGQQIAEEI